MSRPLLTALVLHAYAARGGEVRMPVLRVGTWLKVTEMWGMPFPEMGPDIIEVVDQDGNTWEMLYEPNGPENCQ